MYNPPHFAETDPAAALDIIRAARLATLVTLGVGGLTATHLPLMPVGGVADPDGAAPLRLVGHLAKANGQWRDIDPAVPALAVFQGPEAYVTPSWYAAKRETGKVVPTWNYIAAHAYGRLEIVTDQATLHSIVTSLTDRHEAARPDPWTVADAPDDYVAGMLRGIVGVVLHVDRLEAKRKLSQNRSASDRQSVRTGLMASNDSRDHALAREMAVDDESPADPR